MRNWIACYLLALGFVCDFAVAQNVNPAPVHTAPTLSAKDQQFYDGINASFKADQELQIDFAEAVQRHFMHNSIIGVILKTASRPIYARTPSFVVSEQELLNTTQRNNYKDAQIQMLRASGSKAQFDRLESEFLIESYDLQLAAARGRSQDVLSSLTLGLSIWSAATLWLGLRVAGAKASGLFSIAIPVTLLVLSLLLLPDRMILAFALASPVLFAFVVGIRRLFHSLIMTTRSVQGPPIRAHTKG